MGSTQKLVPRREHHDKYRFARLAVRAKDDRNRPYRVGLLIPMCGAAGMWGPSCIASAEVAVNELNSEAGIAGRPVEITLIDAAEEAQTPPECAIETLIAEERVDALVGMHISAVRQRVVASVRGRVPFIYTPLYEGGETSPGVFAIGDTPAHQLGPAIGHMGRRYRLRKWALIGNDYIWPRMSHAHAKMQFARQQSELVFEDYLPFGSDRLAAAVDGIARSGADAVLISLVGQDAVDFNRIFGSMGLHDRMFRLSCAIEENGLLASGSENLHRLFASSSYFAALNTPANVAFREKYHALHQRRAPTLNALGQSTYEGLHFLAALVGQYGGDWRRGPAASTAPLRYRSVRRGLFAPNAQTSAPIFIARANGYVFDDLQMLT